MKIIKTLLFLLLSSFLTKGQPTNDFHYEYDDSGNRIQRIVLPSARYGTQPKDTIPFSSSITGHAIKIYPNPTEGKLTVNISGYDLIQKAKIQVYDISGRLVFLKESADENTEIDLTKELSGNYFLTVFIDGKSRQWKIVKMN